LTNEIRRYLSGFPISAVTKERNTRGCVLACIAASCQLQIKSALTAWDADHRKGAERTSNSHVSQWYQELCTPYNPSHAMRVTPLCVLRAGHAPPCAHRSQHAASCSMFFGRCQQVELERLRRYQSSNQFVLESISSAMRCM
jgi:hypothetical protein